MERKIRELGVRDILISNVRASGHFEDLFLIASSGAFDELWHRAKYNLRDEPSVSVYARYISFSETAGFKPSFVFDPIWYRSKNPHAQPEIGSALVHYLRYGARKGYVFAEFFDVEWYIKTNGIDTSITNPLAHYVTHYRDKTVSPHPLFDPIYYLTTYPDIAEAGVDPFEHFMTAGCQEGRLPCSSFDTLAYYRMHLNDDRSQHAFLHFIRSGRQIPEVLRPRLVSRAVQGEDPTVYSECEKFGRPAADFEEHDATIAQSRARDAKVIAMYLPQFHPIPENDSWWGKGFSEWRNVPQGLPRFVGHYQPRIPRDLGFYDLRSRSVMRQQIELAKQSGIYGFCFYFYWFNQHRLLERPLDQFIEDSECDFPFCILWANENWTRRWDGNEKEVLIQQDYKPADEEALIATFDGYMRDSRYIRIDGKPVLYIYRADNIPDVQRTLDRWRSTFLQNHGYVPLIVMTQCFGCYDPREHGFDGALEFPPHKTFQNLPAINSELVMLDSTFRGNVYDYEVAIKRSLAYKPCNFPLIKTAFPSWDNNARQSETGMVVARSSPKLYQHWLSELISIARNQPFYGVPLVFVNAWNKWTEGAYLEPDVHFGAAYLNATARAVIGPNSTRTNGILVVGHDAYRHGAQYNLLAIVRTLKNTFGLPVRVLLLKGGDLSVEYSAICETTVTEDDSEINAMLTKLAGDGWHWALTNTVVTGKLVPSLKQHGFKVVSLVHELPGLITECGIGDSARLITEHSDRVVFACDFVLRRFEAEYGAPKGGSAVRPQGLYKVIEPDRSFREPVRSELGISNSTKVIINVGFADLRKGIDLFVATAQVAKRRGLDFHFVWIGNLDAKIRSWIGADIAAQNIDNISFISHTEQIGKYLNASDVFFLSSREDPFPSTVLEALAAGLPAIAFKGASGFNDILADPSFGTVVPYGDIDAAISAMSKLVGSEEQEENRTKRIDYIRNGYRMREAVFAFLVQFDESLKKVSVIVPNYNYNSYLAQRLNSIFDQNYPVFECIVLDDGSTDDSCETILRIAKQAQRDIITDFNTKNGGNAFRQWRRGLSLAEGELIWIAEADDSSEPDFIRTLVSMHVEHKDMLFAFSESSTIDKDGIRTSPSYQSHYAQIGIGVLSSSQVFQSREFAQSYLSSQNLILNVSGVLWSQSALRAALEGVGEEVAQFKVAGDWRVYLEACQSPGTVGFSARSLNIHRRHSSSITAALHQLRHLEEIIMIHAYFCAQLGYTKRADQEKYEEKIAMQFGVDKNVLNTLQGKYFPKDAPRCDAVPSADLTLPRSPNATT